MEDQYFKYPILTYDNTPVVPMFLQILPCFNQATYISKVWAMQKMFGGTDTNIYLCGLKDPENIMKHHTGV